MDWVMEAPWDDLMQLEPPTRTHEELLRGMLIRLVRLTRTQSVTPAELLADNLSRPALSMIREEPQEYMQQPLQEEMLFIQEVQEIPSQEGHTLPVGVQENPRQAGHTLTVGGVENSQQTPILPPRSARVRGRTLTTTPHLSRAMGSDGGKADKGKGKGPPWGIRSIHGTVRRKTLRKGLTNLHDAHRTEALVKKGCEAFFPGALSKGPLLVFLLLHRGRLPLQARFA